MRKFNVRHRAVNAEDLREQTERERKRPAAQFNQLTRRQAIAGVTLALAGMAAQSKAWGQTEQQAVKEPPGNTANHARTSLHQETSFSATPQRIYEALTDAKQFAAFTAMTAEID